MKKAPSPKKDGPAHSGRGVEGITQGPWNLTKGGAVALQCLMNLSPLKTVLFVLLSLKSNLVHSFNSILVCVKCRTVKGDLG